MRSARTSLFILGALLLAGCAHVAVVKSTKPHLPAADRVDPAFVSLHDELAEAGKLERSDPLRALGGYLDVGRSAFDRLSRRSDDRPARDLYDFAVARAIEVIEDAQLDPWTYPLRVPAATGQYLLTSTYRGGPERNPALYEIIPSDTIAVGGKYLQKRVTISGAGAPVVVIGREENKDSRKTLTSRRLYGTVTGIIRFQGSRAEIEFFGPMMTTRVSLGGHSYPLAADFTAPLAVGLSRERPERLGMIRLLRPEKYADTARLTRLQPYDAERIPVIFVHGLQDTPVSWTPMLNNLLEDPEIRRRYQFWVYSYPSGYPYPYSAALFRKELDEVNRAFPGHEGVILIGHSMGGLVSRLLVTDAGQKIWLHVFGKPPARTPLPARTRQLLEESLVFNHRPEVKRVIFMSTPHGGSELASNWIGRVTATLVRTPGLVASVSDEAIAAATDNPETLRIKRLPNSIDTLSPDNRFLLQVNKLPIAPHIPYHSIIGDRGRGDSPNSSDGVVAYWSSHLAGAQSELIVPSNHDTPRNRQAIAEVHRILSESARNN